jgi:NAD(P)H-flavin reductase
MVIRRNGVFRYSGARAHITHEHGAVRVRIQLQKPLDVKAGQAINLWMWIRSVSFWSFLQSHLFVVISWAEKPQEHLDLFIEPQRGLTRDLLYYAKSGHAMNPLVLFSGAHGKSIPMDDCENILMVASGFGIAAHLPYLKQLIHGYNAREVCARRIHLVWQVRDIGKS